jgi:hypothetical protein
MSCIGLPVFWRQATAPETRTLAVALTLGVLVVLLHAWTVQSYRSLIAAWLVWGFALADHYLCLAALPALVLVTICFTRLPIRDSLRPPTSRRLWLTCALALLPGLSLYLLLPLRAIAHPALNWGDPQTPDRFVWMVSTAMYRNPGPYLHHIHCPVYPIQ